MNSLANQDKEKPPTKEQFKKLHQHQTKELDSWMNQQPFLPNPYPPHPHQDIVTKLIYPSNPPTIIISIEPP